MSNIHFRLMAVNLRFRDIFHPPAKILQEARIKPGDTVLDFGCGPGSFSLAASKMVGEEGKVFALDVHPLALRSVQKKSRRKGRQNIEVISSDGATGLPDHVLDVVLVYDVFHELEAPEVVLAELARVLKPEGTISFSDHHLKEEEVLSGITRKGIFRLLGKGQRTYTFQKT